MEAEAPPLYPTPPRTTESRRSRVSPYEAAQPRRKSVGVPQPPPPRRRKTAPRPVQGSGDGALSLEAVASPSTVARIAGAHDKLAALGDFKQHVDPDVLEEVYSAVAKAVASACTDAPPQFGAARKLLELAEACVSERGLVGLMVPTNERLYARASYFASCAVFCRHAGSLEEAAKYCAKSLRLYESLPQSSVTDIAAAKLNSAAALGKLGRHEAAAEEARGAVGVLGGVPGTGAMSAAAYYNLAVELHHCKQYIESRQAIDTAQALATQHLLPTDDVATAISDMQRNAVYKLPKSVVGVRGVRRKSFAAAESPSPLPDEPPELSKTLPPRPLDEPAVEHSHALGAWQRPAESFLPPITPSDAVSARRSSFAGSSISYESRNEVHPVRSDSREGFESSQRASSQASSDMKKRRDGQHQLGSRNVTISRRQYAQSTKKVQKHLSALAVQADKLRIKRERAAIQIQCMVRRCLARLELYNRRQLLYQIFYDKQCFVSNLVKGRNKCRRAKKWLDDRRREVQHHNNLRVEQENAADRAACIISRAWRNYRQETSAALRTRVFEQALLKSRMNKMSERCVWLQRWWRWVRLRKRYWRRRGEAVAAEMAKQRAHDHLVNSATKIQATWRMVLTKADVLKFRRRLQKAKADREASIPYAIRIVKYVLRSVAIRRKWLNAPKPTENELRERGIAVISRTFDGYHARSAISRRLTQLCSHDAAVRVLQRAYRCYRARKTRRVQSLVRSVHLWTQREREAVQERAAYRIQRVYRLHAEGLHTQARMAARGREVIAAVWALQRWWRRLAAGVELRRRRLLRTAQLQERLSTTQAAEDGAARTIQQAWDVHLLNVESRRQRRDDRECLKEARIVARLELEQYDGALIVQRIARGHLARQRLSLHHMEWTNAAVVIQLAHRCVAARTTLHAKRVQYAQECERARFVADLSHEMFCHHSTDLSAVEAEERLFILDTEERLRLNLLLAAHGDGADADTASVASSTSGCYD